MNLIHNYLKIVTNKIKRLNSDYILMYMLMFLLFIILTRLFYLQVLQSEHYNILLGKQHQSATNIVAQRGNIYIYDKAKSPIKLTENINIYEIFVDPMMLQNPYDPTDIATFTNNKTKLINSLKYIIYQHHCVSDLYHSIPQYDCLANIQKFTNKVILPPKPQIFFVFGSGDIYSGAYIYTGSSGQSGNDTYMGYNLTDTLSGLNKLAEQNYNYQQAQVAYDKYDAELASVMSGYTSGQIIQDISDRLDKLIYIGDKDTNFLKFESDINILNTLKGFNYDFVDIKDSYIYTKPKIYMAMSRAQQIQAKEQIINTFQKFGVKYSKEELDIALTPQSNRYVSIMKGVNNNIYQQIQDLKYTYSIKGMLANMSHSVDLSKIGASVDGSYLTITISDQIPKIQVVNTIQNYFQSYGYSIAHNTQQKISEAKNAKKIQIYPLGISPYAAIGSNETISRYYPNKNFMSHILGYLDDENNPHGGVEAYMNNILAGQDGQVLGYGAPWMGQMGSNDMNIKPAIDGADVYLTIDFAIQKELQKILAKYQKEFRADSVSSVIMNPYNGKVIAMANYPDFDPNDLSEINNIKPLGPTERWYMYDSTYSEIPMYYMSGASLVLADERVRGDVSIPKYIHKNLYGPKVLIDKNIGRSYEPGSIFKTFTVAIGLDSDEISLYDFYRDEGKVTIDEYTIKNVAKACIGNWNFLHALQYSCNVGMIRIIQKIGSWTYYRYLEKLGFGKASGIELAGEDPGFVADPNNNSKARFYNNSFGLGILVTPIQLAAGYSTMVNGGYLVKPSIIDDIKGPDAKSIKEVESKKRVKIFKDSTSENIRYALRQVVNGGQIKKFAIPGFTLGGKTGTSQIAYKGKYREGAGWTNGSFAGILTKDNLKYVVIIQIRRPRQSVWGELTAGKIFGDIANYIISYDGINK